MTTHRRRSNHDRTFSSWFATVSHFPRARCGNLENLPGESGSGEPQLGPKVLDLNAEGVLKILGAVASPPKFGWLQPAMVPAPLRAFNNPRSCSGATNTVWSSRSP